jgi:hypothetical protein
MVKIRYADLPAGLHVNVESDGRQLIIYLLPGLTAAERHAAISRIHRSGKVGYGPEVPLAATMIALAIDRTNTTVRRGATALRGHPILLVSPLILLTCIAIVFILVAFGTLTVTVHEPPQALAPGAPADAAGTSPRNHNAASPDPGSVVLPGGAVVLGSPGTAGGHQSGSPEPVPSPAAPGPTPLGTAAPALSPTTGPPAAPATGDPTSSPTTLAPSPSPSQSTGACLKLGARGLCLNL